MWSTLKESVSCVCTELPFDYAVLTRMFHKNSRTVTVDQAIMMLKYLHDEFGIDPVANVAIMERIAAG